MNSKKRCTNTSRQQYMLYLEEMETNEAFRTNKLSPENPNVLDLTWEKLSSKLNASGGPQKSVTAWKKVFADWKCTVKKKARKLKLSQNGTGGGPPEKVLVLSELEEKLIQVIGKVVVDGFLAVPEIGLRTLDDGENAEIEQGCDEGLHADRHNYINIIDTKQNQTTKEQNNKRKSNSPLRNSNPKIQKNNTCYQSKLSLGTTISQLSDIINNKSNIENEVNQSLKNINSNLEKLVQIEHQKLQMLTFEFQQKYPDVSFAS